MFVLMLGSAVATSDPFVQHKWPQTPQQVLQTRALSQLSLVCAHCRSPRSFLECACGCPKLLKTVHLVNGREREAHTMLGSRRGRGCTIGPPKGLGRFCRCGILP